jgi:hypothetical protein
MELHQCSELVTSDCWSVTMLQRKPKFEDTLNCPEVGYTHSLISFWTVYNHQGQTAIDGQRWQSGCSDELHDLIALGFGKAGGHKGILE